MKTFDEAADVTRRHNQRERSVGVQLSRALLGVDGRSQARLVGAGSAFDRWYIAQSRLKTLQEFRDSLAGSPGRYPYLSHPPYQRWDHTDRGGRPWARLKDSVPGDVCGATVKLALARRAGKVDVDVAISNFGDRPLAFLTRSIGTESSDDPDTTGILKGPAPRGAAPVGATLLPPGHSWKGAATDVPVGLDRGFSVDLRVIGSGGAIIGTPRVWLPTSSHHLLDLARGL